MLNKGRAFSHDERRLLGLRGLLPAGVLTLGEQAALEMERLAAKSDDLERYIGLASLQDRNETLFHRLLIDHPDELLPIVYTPTVGRACQEYSRTMRRPRGIWITPDDVDAVSEVLRNAGRNEVRLVVATDNERILGLGDLGAGGMGIPIGKLALYCAGAGIPPQMTLPVSLDVGTDNPSLLGDSSYLGWRHPRLRGQAYLRVVDAFVDGLQDAFPDAVLQWEDLKQHTAIEVLERFRRRLPSFNDDIQGTAGVAVAGVLAALRVTGEPLSRQRVVVLGAGAAGTGIARLLGLAMRRAGVAAEDLRRAIVLLDSHGLLYEGRTPLHRDQREFAQRPEDMAELGFGAFGSARFDFEAVVSRVRPTVLIGTSGAPGSFTEGAIREMARQTPIPVILPLSNPTSQAEATPDDLVDWTHGRALIATGSPFPPVVRGGQQWTIGQANNVFVFPGVGLGLLASGAREATEEMFLAAADTLAEAVSLDRLTTGALYPALSELRSISRSIAIAVARLGWPSSPALVGHPESAVDDLIWYPDYKPYQPA
jgi:malic enzyme